MGLAKEAAVIAVLIILYSITAYAEKCPDINKDNVVDFGDYLFLAERFNSARGDSKYDAMADYNDDGAINFADYLILARVFGKQCVDQSTGMNQSTGVNISAEPCDQKCRDSTPQGYIAYNFGDNTFSKLEADFDWSATPKKNDVGIYPALMHFWFEAGQGGYTGPQIEVINSGSTVKKKVIFSMWSLNDDNFTVHPYEGCAYGNDSEGKYVKCLRDYAWKEGRRYKITVQEEKELVNGTVWNATIRDVESNSEQLIGKILLDDSKGYKGYGRLRGDVYGFFEYYFGEHNKCLEAEYGKIIRYGPYADGTLLPVKATAQSPRCYRSNRYSPEMGVVVEEVGEGVSREVNIEEGNDYEFKVLWGQEARLAKATLLSADFNSDGCIDSKDLDLALKELKELLDKKSYYGEHTIDGSDDEQLISYFRPGEGRYKVIALILKYDLDANGKIFSSDKVMAHGDLAVFNQRLGEGCSAVSTAKPSLASEECIDLTDINLLQSVLDDIYYGKITQADAVVKYSSFNLVRDNYLNYRDVDALKLLVGKGCDVCGEYDNQDDKNKCYIILAARPDVLDYSLCDNIFDNENPVNEKSLRYLCKQKVHIGKFGEPWYKEVASFPGYSEHDVKISADNDYLYISADNLIKKYDKYGSYIGNADRMPTNPNSLKTSFSFNGDDYVKGTCCLSDRYEWSECVRTFMLKGNNNCIIDARLSATDFAIGENVYALTCGMHTFLKGCKVGIVEIEQLKQVDTKLEIFRYS